MKTIRNVVYLLTLALLLPSAQAATMTRAWVNSYHGPALGDDNAFAIAVDASGDVFVAGQSTGTAGTYDYLTIKYSNSGSALWTNRYHGPGAGSDQAKALAVDASGNAIVTGKSSGPTSRTEFATIKYSGQGLPLWTNRYRAVADDAAATAVRVDTNGDVVVTGYTLASGFVTIKYSRLGLPLWTNRYIGPVNLNHYAAALALDGSGKAFVGGSSTGSGTGDDFVTLAYSSAGAPLWTNRFNGPGNGNDEVNGLAVDSQGNVLATGGAIFGGVAECVTIKYSNAGVPVWTNRYRGAQAGTFGGGRTVAVDGSDNVIVAANLTGSGNSHDFWTLKYSNAGIPLWTNSYPGSYDDAVNAVALDRNGNVFVTGYRTDYNYLCYDYVTIGYSSAGLLVCYDYYNGPANSDDTGNAIATDGSGNVFVTGYSKAANGYADIVTFKYSTTSVTPPLGAQRSGNAMVLSWANTLFGLQSAPAAAGTFTNVSGATSPCTNSLTGPQKFFRLKAN